MEPIEVRTPDGVFLRGEVAGDGPAVLLLHGLTATRRYVLHGSAGVERAGFRVIAYDARGHGESSPAHDPAAYTYAHLARDAVSVLDACGADRAVLVASPWARPPRRRSRSGGPPGWPAWSR